LVSLLVNLPSLPILSKKNTNSIGWGNLNGVMSSNVYRGIDAPHYTLGHSVVLGYLAVGLLGGSILNYVLLKRENEKRRRGERDHWVQGLNHKEVEYLGDKRYVVPP
jgi:hypothetical protein